MAEQATPPVNTQLPSGENEAALSMQPVLNPKKFTKMKRLPTCYQVYSKLKSKFGNENADTEYWLKQLRSLKAKNKSQIIKTMDKVKEIFQEMEEAKLKFMNNCLPTKVTKKYQITLDATANQLYDMIRARISAKSYFENWDSNENNMDDSMDIGFLSKNRRRRKGKSRDMDNHKSGNKYNKSKQSNYNPYCSICRKHGHTTEKFKYNALTNGSNVSKEEKDDNNYNGKQYKEGRMADPYLSNVWNTMNEVNRLREDAITTAYDILKNVQENYVTVEEVKNLETQINNQFNELNKNTENFKEVLEAVSNKLNVLTSRSNDTDPIPHFPPPPPSTAGSTRYDLDFDVIMKNRYTSPINQVPDPGFFYGDTELFCQISNTMEFRSYSQLLNWNEEALALIFYNGLHPKYQEEINKMYQFSTTLEIIFTKCVLFEENMNIKNKINNINDSKRKSNHGSNSKNNNNYNYNRNNYYKDEHQTTSTDVQNSNTINYNLATFKNIVDNNTNLPPTFFYFNIYISPSFFSQVSNISAIPGIISTPCRNSTIPNVSNNTNFIHSTNTNPPSYESENSTDSGKNLINNNTAINYSSNVNEDKHKVSNNIEIEYNYNFLNHCFLTDKYENQNDDIDDNSLDPSPEDIPAAYRDLSVVFSKQEADKLLLHRLTDCFIRPSESPAGYPVNNHGIF
ncbi:hypothetical protein PIROE2DRAFT_7131 [Piromyces sp. E2]|nr:hypothetical protein PIROE2DRAFT_7131 [Piromyces sp. E2]|eukprot:OUM65803.1 hypothetical protein PIROE2DRAFT_7131 [Piromyces sp. E2]